MPKKRKSAESKNDEQKTEGSKSLYQDEDNAKRVELDLLSHTTLQDLPMELLECILVKVVVLEVKELKLAKRVWKEKADLVISRLSNVCSQWSNILSTKSFEIKLHRILDGTAQKIRLEVVQKSRCPSDVRGIADLDDDRFLLFEPYKRDPFIHVFDRGNMDDVKQVIRLPGKDPAFMTGCRVSNCVYLRLEHGKQRDFSLFRISKDAEQQLQYIVSPWESERSLSVCMMSVSANGDLVVYSGLYGTVTICKPNGSIEHEIKLCSPLVDVHNGVSVLQKSSGNVVLSYVSDDDYLTRVLEIDSTGTVVRRFHSTYSEESFVNFVDIHDRIMICPPFDEFELLDSDFNLVGVYSQPEDDGALFDQHFDSVSNEVVRILHDKRKTNRMITYRLTEEWTT